MPFLVKSLMAAWLADNQVPSAEPCLWVDPLEGPVCTPPQAPTRKAPPEAPRGGPRLLLRQPDSWVLGSELQRGG